MKKTILLYFLLGSLFPLAAQTTTQTREYRWQATIGGGTAARPFWLHNLTRNVIAPDTYLWSVLSCDRPFRRENTRAFDWSCGVEAAGSVGTADSRLFFSRLYGSVRWQRLRFSAGLFDRPEQYDGLSATNGNLLYSNNSRNMPGLSLASDEYIRLPWVLGRFLAFRFRYGEYLMTDHRYVRHTRVHNKMLAGRLTVVPQLELEYGLEDFAQWSGESPQGRKHYKLYDYFKLIAGKSGGADASRSDQINKLGNHLGCHFARITWQPRRLTATLYYNHQFEDGSGMDYKNFPDGLYGIYLAPKGSWRWITGFVYEFYCTKDQSGPRHDRPATEDEMAQKDPDDPYPDRIVLNGNDNYLNHGEYQSGWTLFGQTIGAPFFTPGAVRDGITCGISNNRFLAHHWGLRGELPWQHLTYRLMCSYSRNYGRHSAPFLDADGQPAVLRQFSLGLQLRRPMSRHLPFDATLHLALDHGRLFHNRAGLLLTFSRSGFF